VQSFHAEHQAVAGDVMASPQAWQILSQYFVAKTILDDGVAKLLECKDPVRKQSVHKNKGAQYELEDDEIFSIVRNYVPGAVIPFLSKSEEKWASELRRVTCIFINLVCFVLVFYLGVATF
jgi:hypothetical protein